MIAGQTDEHPIRGRPTGPVVGQGFHQGIEIDVVALPLTANEPLTGLEQFELVAEATDLTPILFEGLIDKGVLGRRQLLFPDHAPVLAKSLAAIVPFVVDHRFDGPFSFAGADLGETGKSLAPLAFGGTDRRFGLG